MLLSDIHLWHVYRDPMCQHTNPPKSKYVFVAAIEDETIHGFLFNTNLPKFVTSTPGLLACEVAMKRAKQGFPFSDCFLDCTRLYEFQAKDFNEDLGQLSEPAKLAYIYAVRDCPMLTGKSKKIVAVTIQKVIENDGKA